LFLKRNTSFAFLNKIAFHPAKPIWDFLGGEGVKKAFSKGSVVRDGTSQVSF